VFGTGYDGTDVNAVDTDHNRKYLVAGDDFGSIAIYKYPVMKNTA
jgi:hypothetical protein